MRRARCWIKYWLSGLQLQLFWVKLSKYKGNIFLRRRRCWIKYWLSGLLWSMCDCSQGISLGLSNTHILPTQYLHIYILPFSNSWFQFCVYWIQQPGNAGRGCSGHNLDTLFYFNHKNLPILWSYDCLSLLPPSKRLLPHTKNDFGLSFSWIICIKILFNTSYDIFVITRV